MERKPNKSQHTKLILEKKILPLLLQRFELATFRSRVQRSYQQAIQNTTRHNTCSKTTTPTNYAFTRAKTAKNTKFFLSFAGSQHRRPGRCRLFTFTWPDVRDTAWVAKEQIRHVLDNPQITMRDHYIFELSQKHLHFQSLGLSFVLECRCS